MADYPTTTLIDDCDSLNSLEHTMRVIQTSSDALQQIQPPTFRELVPELFGEYLKKEKQE